MTQAKTTPVQEPKKEMDMKEHIATPTESHATTIRRVVDSDGVLRQVLKFLVIVQVRESVWSLLKTTPVVRFGCMTQRKEWLVDDCSPTRMHQPARWQQKVIQVVLITWSDEKGLEKQPSYLVYLQVCGSQ
eukprot:5827147-Amphidinium_carterae.2